MRSIGGGEVIYADSVQPKFGTPYVDLVEARARLERENPAGLTGFDLRVAELDEAMETEPTRYGWRLPSWDKVMAGWKDYGVHCILGGNRSTKSTLASRCVVDLAMKIPEAEIRCWHVNEARSIEDQQRFVWEALPKHYKDLAKKRGRNFSINYSQGNGFTNAQCILPPQQGYKRGSTIKFQNYRQYQQDSQVGEGFKAHGVWLDEEAPYKLFDTMLYRLVDYRGRMLLTFTTLRGWTPLLADILGKTKTLERRYAPLVKEELPVLQESLNRKGCRIYYFWTEDNPWVPSADLMKTLAGRPIAERKARAYGVPTKSAQAAFPKFRADVHVIAHESLPWIRDPGKADAFTRYMCVDGAGARNWFIVWVAVDAAGTWWVYCEWPDEAMGEWAEPGSEPGGVRGIGQQSLGDGTQAYVDRIRMMEGEDVVFERYMDPRFAATEKQLKDGTITPQQELAELGMHFIAAPGVTEDQGIQALNALLEWDESKPMDTGNSPRMFISDRCRNVIFALSEYTGTRGKDEPTKDPVDALRYLAVSNIEFFETKQANAVRMTAGGY